MTTATETREITLLPGQASILTNFDDRILAACAGTGGGKTVLGYWWLHSRMETYPGFTWGMAEPTWPMLDKIILNSSDPDRPTLEQYLRSVGHHPILSKVERIIRTDFGQIYLYTAENPYTMQGAAVKGFWLDEAGQMSLLAHETALQRCSMMEGQELITTTPYNLGWLLTEVVNKKGPGIAVEQWRSIDRPGFPRDSYEYMRERLPAWRFAMLYDAQFEKPAGLIYLAFDEKVCVIDRFPISANWLVYVGHDFGADNPCALFYAQDPGTGNFFLFDEYLPGQGLSANEHIINFKKIIRLPGEEGKENPKTYNVIKRVGGSKAGEDDSRSLYTAHGWVINEPKIGKVAPRIDKVIGLHQLNKVFCFRDMSHYLDEKRTFSYKLNQSGEIVGEIDNESRFHVMSAEQYILSDFTPETVVSDQGYRTTTPQRVTPVRLRR